MFWFLYDLGLFFASAFILPKILWDRIFRGKYKQCLRAYFSLSLPRIPAKKGRVFLIYAVSMGETKAAAALFAQIKNSEPEAQIYLCSRTETGQAEAKKSIQKADGYFFMPFDFSFAIKRFLNHIRPDIVIVVESDFWPNFLRLSKKRGALVFLVSGKISDRSSQRFHKIYYLAKKLLSFFDCICVQNSTYKERFINLGVDPFRILESGNLKFDTPLAKTDLIGLKQELGIQEKDLCIVIASTHFPEEKEILERLKPLCTQFPNLKLIFIPRHPERFLEVKELFSNSGLSFISYTDIQMKTGNEVLFLIDAMGRVVSFYQIAEIAIVGGSFDARLKGHNIFEAVQTETPVFFGPYMSDQRDLVECVLSAKAGEQLDLVTVYSRVLFYLENPSSLEEMRAASRELRSQVEGSSFKTWKVLLEKINAS